MGTHPPAGDRPHARGGGFVTARDSIEQLVKGELHDPHSLLGSHRGPVGSVVRAWRPGAQSVDCIADDRILAKLELVHPAGLFEDVTEEDVGDYLLQVTYPGADAFTIRDPYSFL